MKIFCNASISGKREYGDSYKLIKDAVEKAGGEIIACPVMRLDIGELIKSDSKKANTYYRDLKKWIKDADVCVFEVSFPSTHIGHEIALALQFSKPVIAFHVKGAPKNLVLDSITSDNLQLIDYEPGNVSRLVKSALDYASEQADTRFNFFVSPDISTYLDWVSKEKKIPRAVYLRSLIEADMEEEEFEE